MQFLAGQMTPTVQELWARPWVRALVLAVVYSIASLIGRSVLLPAVFVAPVRLSMGVAVVALLLNPVRTWPLLLAAMAPVHLLLRGPGSSYVVPLLYYLANVAGAITTVAFIRWSVGARLRFDDLRGTLSFLLVGLTIGPLVSAAFGTWSVAARDLSVSLWSTWTVWALADAVGLLVVVPFALSFGDVWREWKAGSSRARCIEAAILSASIFLATGPTFAQVGVAGAGMSLVLLYLPFPLLIWAARRFGPAGAALANVQLVIITIVHVALRRGPFGLPWDADTVLAVQQFTLLAAGTAVALAGSIAERRQAMQELRDSEARYRDLIEAATDTILFVTRDGIITQLNRAFEKATGWQRAEWIGKSVFTLLKDKDAATAQQLFADVLVREDDGIPSKWQIPVADGGWRTVEVLTTVYQRQGQPDGVMIIARDITEKERTAERQAVETAQRQQTAKMQAIGYLAGGIAHDFNNMLHAVRGYTEIARGTTDLDHPARRPLTELDQVTDRAAALARQLLAFSRREPVRSEVLRLDQVVSEFVDILRRVLGVHIPITITAVSDAAAIRADRNEIGQVLMNLSINARDAMPDGGPLVVETGSAVLSEADLAGQPDRQPGRWTYLRVTDRGHGIPEHIRPHIFEPFFTTKGTGQGTGLGLATVYAIADRHGGFVTVQTETGKGTSFTVHFPATDEPAPMAAVTAVAATAPAGTGETILVAEDEQAVRELATELLEAAGYRVIPAEDGREAEGIVRDAQVRIDLALLDVVMPHRHGRDVFEVIQAVRPGLPVVFSTGYSFGELSDLPAPEMVTTLMKPYSRAALLTSIRTGLDKSVQSAAR